MISRIKTFLRGSASFLLIAINTLFWCVPLFAFAILKLIVPLPPWRRTMDGALNWIATNWISVNNLNLALFNSICWEISGDELEPRDWYLVLSNHQSWSDILVLQKVFNRRIPFLKFFIKQELIWVPVLGLAWWALDYPFMKRYSKEKLEKHPELKGKDFDATKRACEKFRTRPISVMNFVEGTRFTPTKKDSQRAPYNHLLRPKAAGIGFVISALGDCMRSIVNVTIAYPEGAHGLWGFISGRVKRVRVHVEVIPVSRELLGDYLNDPAFREKFQEWINGLWAEKDLVMADLIEGRTPAARQ